MEYTKTEDPNIIKQTEQVESEIHIDKLEKQVTDLETQINNTPKLKTKPDQETLDYYNGMIEEVSETELKEKQELLSKLKKL